MRLILKFFLILITLLPTQVFSQQGWWIHLKNKGEQTFDPYLYFDAKAIERRQVNNLPLNDPTDWPVHEDYVWKIQQIADSTLFASRWFNAVAIYANESQICKIQMLPFVSEVEKAASQGTLPASVMMAEPLDTDDSLLMVNQVQSLQGDLFQKAGIDGKGVRIAIFDVGFPGANENPAFSEIISSGRLIATKDFTKRKGEDVFWGKSHGTEVWSCIAGKIGEKRLGLATGAEFLLAKTEVNREPFSEEVHWLAAAEWADQNGADIINSSLGYTKDRYFPWDMNGKKSFVARAANMAARKGMLVVNAAGNEGDGDWQTIGTPADADSVLSVGGIDPETGFHTSFSSFGPTADKRMKPNVSAFGHVIAALGESYVKTQGTSFASPLVAGFAACALQLNKGMGNMELFREIEKSATLYPYFDYAHGYGVPQASWFLNKGKDNADPTFQILDSANMIRVIVREDLVHPEENEDDNTTDYSFNPGKYLYYNIMNNQGIIDYYFVVKVTDEEVVTIDRNDFTEGETLNVHYAGYTSSVKISK